MMSTPHRRTARIALLALAAAAGPAAAQYKVIGPDGKVTYTDRQPSAREGKVSELGARPELPAAETPLPAELRQAASRYPVTLYTTSSACEPCDAGRALLRQRGVPFRERLVVSNEDGEALQRLSGGRDAPTLTIGAQVVRGLSSDTWNSYLDGAGYPRESRLPPGYQYPAATPLTERRDAAPARAAAPAPAPTPVAPPAPPATEPAIRF
ncbi:MAG: glutaredoxin family protein [Piscinibacter sp.]|nr:glutaredoxin family protein [Piscinibacter sp.]